jgi:hypothetical protein
MGTLHEAMHQSVAILTLVGTCGGGHIRSVTSSICPYDSGV